MLGKLFHLALDAALVAMVLSGVRRTTGITPSLIQVPSKDARNLLRAYLETGEWVRIVWVAPAPFRKAASRSLLPPSSYLRPPSRGSSSVPIAPSSGVCLRNPNGGGRRGRRFVRAC